MDYQPILDEIYSEVQPLIGQGGVADYIPALARVAPDHFGLALRTVDGRTFSVGDANISFSIQSISKVFTLTLAIQFVGARIWDRVGREPSGNPFNSLVQLEYEQGRPRNPFINAGAHVVTDCVVSHCGDARGTILDFVRARADRPALDYDHEVAHSEAVTGHRNRALANFLKAFGRLDNDVDTVLDVYFHQCSLSLSCLELAQALLFLANGGRDPRSGEQVLGPRQTKRINAVMQTCGLYDAVGEFAYRVGLPGKSGVGGGIVAVHPGHWTAVAWSPGLLPSGNSAAGMMALELLTTKTGMSIF